MFRGVWTALVTPFRDGAVDERALVDLVELQIGAGVDGLVPCGSTGESATLSHAEHRRTVEVAVAAARGRVPVLAGTGSNSTREAIELTRYAKEAGADGALLISPYYNKPTQAGIVEHYATIARETGFPLVVYNIPGRTASNVAPAEMVELVRAFRAGDLARARDLHYRLLPLFDALFVETNPIPVKAALALRGLVRDEIRLPLTRLTEPNRERLRVVLKELGIL